MHVLPRRNKQNSMGGLQEQIDCRLIRFLEIPERVERALADVPRCQELTLARVLEADALARETVYALR